MKPRKYLTCENDFCIYNRGFRCILDEIELDATGSCLSCISVLLDHDLLLAEKKRQVEELENKYYTNPGLKGV